MAIFPAPNPPENLSRRGPSWLGELLSETYFTSCPAHAAAHKSERNFFCLECGGKSLCSVCVQKDHSGPRHKTLQIRRSSYHEAVRVSDVIRLIDISHIQVYVINSAKIVFLNGRPQARLMKGAPYHCETCQRTLLDACRFCSIGCKMSALAEDATLSMQPRLQPPGMQSSYYPTVEDSGESLSRPKSFSSKKRSLPELLTDDGESEEESSDEEAGSSSVKRKPPFSLQKCGGFEREREEVWPKLLPLALPGNEMLPVSPAQSPVLQSSSNWRTHPRKGIPHRAPLG